MPVIRFFVSLSTVALSRRMPAYAGTCQWQLWYLGLMIKMRSLVYPFLLVLDVSALVSGVLWMYPQIEVKASIVRIESLRLDSTTLIGMIRLNYRSSLSAGSCGCNSCTAVLWNDFSLRTFTIIYVNLLTAVFCAGNPRDFWRECSNLMRIYL